MGGHLQGTVVGGRLPIQGATLQLFAAATDGSGSAATPLLSEEVQTDAAGSFDIAADFSCPSPDATIYIEARGGALGIGNGARNVAIGLLALLGRCDQVHALNSVRINEVTTVASVWPLADYISQGGSVSFPNAAVATSVSSEVALLADVSQGSAPGIGLPSFAGSILVPKLNSLANALASCVDSDGSLVGGLLGGGSPCQQLLTASTFSSEAQPADTLAAAITLAQHAQQSLPALFPLSTASTAFQPSLPSAPADWELTLSTPAAPELTPGTGSYSPGQTVIVTDSEPDADLHYTLDGSVPTASSPVYTSPIAIDEDSVLKAVAVREGLLSATTVGTYTVQQSVHVQLTPAASTLGPSQTLQMHALVTGNSNQAVTWSQAPAVGSLSPSGLYTAPASITIPFQVQLTATSVADPTASASVAVALTAGQSLAVAVANPTVQTGSSTPVTVTLSTPAVSPVSITLSGIALPLASISPGVLVVPAGQMQAVASMQGLAPGVGTLVASASGYLSSSALLTVLPPPIPGTYFGMTIKDYLNAVPNFPFGTTRSWDASPKLAWTEINTAMGVYDFSGVDQFIQVNQARHAEIIYTFGRTPQWASSKPQQPATYGPGQCAAPSNMALWDAFVTALTAHVAGRIHYWELWNEPNSQDFFCGDMPTMVTMAQHAYRIIKAADPQAIVLSPGMTSAAGPSWLGYFLYLGGTKYVDAIAFHGYSSIVAGDMTPLVAQYRVSMVANGAAKLPIWDTEASWAGDGTLPTSSMQDQVAFLSQDYLLQRSLGIERLVWYAFDGGSTWGGLWDAEHGPSAAARAFQETYRWMTGASLTSPCAPDANLITSCGLARSGGYQAEAIWSASGTKTITLPNKYVEARDLSGNVVPIQNHIITLNNQPILVETGTIP